MTDQQRMTNDELVHAIERTRQMVLATDSPSISGKFLAHLALLLEEQLKRARA